MFGFENHKVKDLNEYVKCNLCNGYLIEATTITECMHSFCKACIVKHLETFSTCPMCKCQLNEVKPYLDIKSDNVLQSIVYQLFPSVFEDEMKRREIHSNSKVKSETDHHLSCEKDAFSDLEDDFISVELIMRNNVSSLLNCMETPPVYLLCPSIFTVENLSKFLAQKFQVSSSINLCLFRVPNSKLNEKVSLADIICTNKYNKQRPLRIYYSFITATIDGEFPSQQLNNLAFGIEGKDLFFVRDQSKSFPNERNRLAKNRLWCSSKSDLLQNV